MFEQDFHGAFTIIVPDLKPRVSGGRCYSRLLLIDSFWERKAKMAFCCFPLKTAVAGTQKSFSGISGPSVVFAKPA